jgi:tetratricopeptide (TPR) repeat protein
MVPAPLTTPSLERHIAIDASSGIYAPAVITIDEIYRGDDAVGLNPAYAALTPEQRDQQMTEEAKGFFDGFSVTGSSVHFDPAKRELHISIKGSAKLNWKDGWFFVPTSSIGFDPDFDRPAGPLHDVPIAVTHPRYAKDEATIRLPPGFAAQQKLDPAVHETLAGVEYARSETVNGDVLTVDSSERSIAPEVPYKEAVAAAPRLKAIDKDDIYLRKVAYRATDKDLAALANSTPGSADEYVERGNMYLDARKYDEAIADYTAALKLDPQHEWALADRAIAHVWKREFADAQNDIAAAEARNPTNSVALRAQALMAEFKGECDKAVDFYTRSLASQPGRSFNIGHRAMCEANLSRYDSALADSALALKDDPTWLDLHFLRASVFTRQGKKDLAAAEAEAVTAKDPTSDYAWVGAGMTYAALGQRDRAMKALDHALAIKPAAYIYIDRAAVREKSDTDGRLADLDSALKLEPNNPAGLQAKAQLLSEKGDYKGALAWLDRVKLDPKTNKFVANFMQEQRAILMYKAGQTADAEKLFAELKNKNPEAVELNNLCYDQATAGIRLEDALEDCRAALKVSPDDGAYLDSLGMVLLKLGKLDEALSAYNEAVAKGEGAASLMGRAFVYLRKGDKTHAEADAEAARKLSPDIDDTFAQYGLTFREASAAAAPQQSAATKH